jgi:hypothetical protein
MSVLSQLLMNKELTDNCCEEICCFCMYASCKPSTKIALRYILFDL